MIRIFLPTLVFVLLASTARLAGQTTPTVTQTIICRVLADPYAFAGKIVSFRAQFDGTWEGAYLDASCSRRFKDGSNAIYVGSCSELTIKGDCREEVKFTSTKDSRAFSDLAKELCNAMRYCKYDYIAATFTGQIVSKKDYWYQPRSGWGNGYGNMRATRTAIILTRIDNPGKEASRTVRVPNSEQTQ